MYMMITSAPTPMRPSHHGNSEVSSMGVSGVIVFQIGVESPVEFDDVDELVEDVVIVQLLQSSMTSGDAVTISGVDKK